MNISKKTKKKFKTIKERISSLIITMILGKSSK